MNRTAPALVKCCIRRHRLSASNSLQSASNTSPLAFQIRNFAKSAHQGAPKRKVKAPKSKASLDKKRIPAMLSATASPHVFVAKAALDETIDPSTLFSDGATIPPMLATGTFQYLSPKKDLNFQYPSHGVPEVAFLGRSNVGKSSLINAVMRKNLCVTSKSPGRTQLPHFMALFPNDKEDQTPANASGLIIDLPGYGYAAAPRETVEAWQQDTQKLLLDRLDRGVLKRLFLLMDARRDEFAEMDRAVLGWLEDAQIPYSVVLTKTDRTTRPKVIRLVNELCLRYSSQLALDEGDFAFQSPVIHTTSSKQKWGVHELMLSLEAEFAQDDDDDDGDDSDEDLD
ncbi:unnamed protein product [Cylindrotheca closterium]|uniref:EngB-type G domain-containing protein n=1 Tax=Cylindrotheca closterium TaxID=2856 RepID=A0AAD2G3E3_9STRA|nr:unnamed protein product [Cylindrotheca closterium]